MSETAKDLDQFYTHPEISKRFVEKVNEIYDLSSYDYVIEPSMGEGFIYEHLPTENRIGLDIEKNHDECLEGDFFEWTPEKSGITYEPLLGEYPRMIFVGNPPFGRSSSLAIDFFIHASNYGDDICFVIPKTWSKFSVQNRLPTDFGLYYEAVLPEHAFIFNGRPYGVRCVAQCWSRNDPNPGYTGPQKEDWQDMDLS
jgi:hypothetical protein